MNIEEFREYCLAKAGVTEELPFGPDTLVFKVKGKMFALTGLNAAEFTANLKCEPEKAIELREGYPHTVKPGYHMNKKHWNTIHMDNGGLSGGSLRELIDHSYDLVVQSLPKKVQEELNS